jgi:hypothetical protein
MSDKTRGTNTKNDDFTENYCKCSLSTTDLKIKQMQSEAIPVKEKLSFAIAWIRKIFEDAVKAKDSLVYPS